MYAHEKKDLHVDFEIDIDLHNRLVGTCNNDQAFLQSNAKQTILDYTTKRHPNFIWNRLDEIENEHYIE